MWGFLKWNTHEFYFHVVQRLAQSFQLVIGNANLSALRKRKEGQARGVHFGPANIVGATQDNKQVGALGMLCVEMGLALTIVHLCSLFDCA